MELQRLRSPVRSGAIDSYGFSSLGYGDWHSGRSLFSLRILISFCGDAHRHCDTFTRREMRCCTIDVGSHIMHLGRRSSRHFSERAAYTGSSAIFPLDTSFPLSTFVFFSERVFWIFALFLHTLAWSHHTRVILRASRLRRGRAFLFYSSSLLFFNVVTMGRSS